MHPLLDLIGWGRPSKRTYGPGSNGLCAGGSFRRAHAAPSWGTLPRDRKGIGYGSLHVALFEFE
jgi:hypothetical protein